MANVGRQGSPVQYSAAVAAGAEVYRRRRWGWARYAFPKPPLDPVELLALEFLSTPDLLAAMLLGSQTERRDRLAKGGRWPTST